MAAGSGGVVKHLLLARFNEEVMPERLDGLIRRYAALVDAVPSMKAFHWFVPPTTHPLRLPWLGVRTAAARLNMRLIWSQAVSLNSPPYVCGH